MEKKKGISHKKVWFAFGGLVALIFTISFVPSLFARDCPEKTYGENNTTYVKYFSSPLCAACWLQIPIIEKIAAENGNRFLLEEYDVDYCRQAASPYYVRGVPAFLVNYAVTCGLQTEEQLKKITGV